MNCRALNSAWSVGSAVTHEPAAWITGVLCLSRVLGQSAAWPGRTRSGRWPGGRGAPAQEAAAGAGRQHLRGRAHPPRPQLQEAPPRPTQHHHAPLQKGQLGLSCPCFSCKDGKKKKKTNRKEDEDSRALKAVGNTKEKWRRRVGRFLWAVTGEGGCWTREFP